MNNKTKDKINTKSIMGYYEDYEDYDYYEKDGHAVTVLIMDVQLMS